MSASGYSRGKTRAVRPAMSVVWQLRLTVTGEVGPEVRASAVQLHPHAGYGHTSANVRVRMEWAEHPRRKPSRCHPAKAS